VVGAVTAPTTITFSKEMMQMSPSTDDRLMITDARTIRMMTTPVRKVVVDELYRTQSPHTATELENFTGISASAMSYHLRELERVGVIRRADVDAGDGRERPWVPVARNYSIVASDHLTIVDRVLHLDSWLNPMRERMLDVLERRSPVPEANRRENYMVLAVGDLLLTRDEMTEVQNEIDAVWRRFEDVGLSRDPSGDYHRARYMWSCLPLEPGEHD
jgi:DNA-binding transcriptional ArsR family regulator